MHGTGHINLLAWPTHVQCAERPNAQTGCAPDHLAAGDEESCWDGVDATLGPFCTVAVALAC